MLLFVLCWLLLSARCRAADTAPDSTLLAAAPAAPAAAKGTSDLVSNVFFESDLRQALIDVSTQTGITVVADSTVQGTISMALKDLPLEKALTLMLQPGGYSFAKLEGYYLVGAPDPSNPNFYLLTKTESLTLKYISPQAVISLLSTAYGRYLSFENGLSAAQVAAKTKSASSSSLPATSTSSFYFPGSNTDSAASPVSTQPDNIPSYRLMITAPPCMIPRIRDEIAAIDQPLPQVMLEACVVEISDTGQTQLALNGMTKWFQQDLTSGGPNFLYSKIANTEMAQLTALLSNGKARLRANPRVATSEGQTAAIEVGTENYFAITAGPVSYPQTTLERITAGITLHITPHIIEDRQEVIVHIEPSVRDVIGLGTNGLPEINFRSAATSLRVHDGESIVIGGLTDEYSSRTENKVPILSSLPVVGGLFRSLDLQKIKSEVVIIITPHILLDGAPVTAGSPELQQTLQMKSLK